MYRVLLLVAFLWAEVQILPVKSSPEPDNVSLQIVFPQEDSLQADTVYLQFRIRGFSLGKETAMPRADEIAISPLGQTLHVVLDDNPYFARIGPAIDPFEDKGDYYETMVKFDLPYALSKGKHSLRAFLCRSYGESLKGVNSFAVREFYFCDKDKDGSLSKPYLTFNEPSGNFVIKEKQPVLLDFYVSGCELSCEGYQVRVLLDEKIEKNLIKWTPYYIYGLAKGSHTIRLTLYKGKDIVGGPYNDVVSYFTID